MRSTDNNSVHPAGGLPDIALSSVFGTVLSFILILLLSAVVMLSGNPAGLSLPAVLLVAGLSSLFAGARSAGRSPMMGMLAGMIAGGFYYLLLLIVGFAVCYKLFQSTDAIWLFIVCIGAGAAGGIFRKNNRRT